VFLDALEVAPLIAVVRGGGVPFASGMLTFRLSTGGEIQMAVMPIPARYDIFC
jgi:NAD-dependent SIR2 family protein deacetylase